MQRGAYATNSRLRAAPIAFLHRISPSRAPLIKVNEIRSLSAPSRAPVLFLSIIFRPESFVRASFNWYRIVYNRNAGSAGQKLHTQDQVKSILQRRIWLPFNQCSAIRLMWLSLLSSAETATKNFERGNDDGGSIKQLYLTFAAVTRRIYTRCVETHGINGKRKNLQFSSCFAYTYIFIKSRQSYTANEFKYAERVYRTRVICTCLSVTKISTFRDARVSSCMYDFTKKKNICHYKFHWIFHWTLD